MWYCTSVCICLHWNHIDLIMFKNIFLTNIQSATKEEFGSYPFFFLLVCVCVFCCFALAFPQIAAPSGFAGCSCMVKLLANKKWFDWGESCSWAALFNGGEVNFNLGWVVLLLSLTSIILIKEFLSIYRSDSEILGPNNQYLPKIVAVFAEVSFSWLYWLSTLNFSAWLSNNENVLVTSKDVLKQSVLSSSTVL